MWQRLDERFGRASKLTDTVMFDIKLLKPITERDDKTFLHLVNSVEKGYMGLKAAKMESEISNTTIVSLIEEKLLKLIKRECVCWSARKTAKLKRTINSHT